MGVVKWTNIYGREREGENLVSFTQHKNYEIVCNLDATFFKVNLSLESTLKEPKLINLLEIIWDDERLVNIVYAISWWKVKSLVWHWGFQQSQYVMMSTSLRYERLPIHEFLSQNLYMFFKSF